MSSKRRLLAALAGLGLVLASSSALSPKRVAASQTLPRRTVPRAVPRAMVLNAQRHNENETDNNEMTNWQRGMSLALAASYFTVMGAKCALPTVLPLLLDPDTGLVFANHWQLSRQELVSRQLSLATLAVAMGKLLLGPVIDRLGGVWSLQVALTALGGLLTTISMGSSFLGFAIAWIGVDFIFSSCWAACINAIHQSFPPDQWATRIGTLAAAARLGNAVAFASFAAILQFFTGRVRQTWRPVFAISAVIQAFPLLLLRYYGTKISWNRQSPRKTNAATLDRPSVGQSLQTLGKEAATPEFWLHLVSRSALMVFASFLLFVPTLMCQVYQASPALGAQTGSIYAVGCLLAVTVVSQLYARCENRGKVKMLLGLLGMAVASSGAQWAHVSGRMHLSTVSSAALLFLWGLSFAIPFYVPPSLYALSRGGVQSSATIADVFDVGGFSLLALFNGYVAGITHATPAAWIPTFGLTTACASLSLVTLPLAVYFEGRREQKEK